MSTNGYENWAVDLADVGGVYPFQGLEVPMVIAGIVFWLWWHVAQSRGEKREFKREVDEYSDKKAVEEAIDRY